MLTEDGETLESVGLGLAPNTAAYGRQMGMPRSAAPEEPIEVAAASGGADDGAALRLPRPRRLLRADLHVRRGGRLLPARCREGRPPPRERVPARERPRLGPAPVAAADLLVVSQPAAERVARHLSTPALVVSVLASGAFDAMTLAQARSRPALSAVAQGLARRPARDGARAAGPASAGAPRGDAAARVVPRGPRRAAAARPARLGANGLRNAPDVSEVCPPAGAASARAVASAGPIGCSARRGRSRSTSVRECGTGRTMPVVPTEDLTALYPGTYDAHRLPTNAALRALATLLFRLRYRRALQAPPLGALTRGTTRSAAGRRQWPGRPRRHPRRARVGT